MTPARTCQKPRVKTIIVFVQILGEESHAKDAQMLDEVVKKRESLVDLTATKTKTKMEKKGPIFLQIQKRELFNFLNFLAQPTRQSYSLKDNKQSLS